MKAITVQEDAGIEGLVYGEVSTPEPGEGEVRVKLLASGINHIDVYQCTPAMVRHEKPHTMGADGAGVVDKAGPGAALKPGTEVVVDPNLGDPTQPGYGLVGAQSPGTHAEFIVLPEKNFFPKPENLTFEEAAALPLALTTAYRQLISRARLKAGENILVHGVGGGVMLYCLQLAAHTGAFSIVTSSSEEKLKTAESLGADVCINYKTGDVASAVMEATDGRGVDVVVDNVGAPTFALSAKCVALNGRITIVGGAAHHVIPEVNLRDLYFKQVDIHTSTMATPEEFQEAMALAAEGKVKAHIDSTYPLSRFREAIERVAEGLQFGKVVITRD
jgi:zinc-binding alcohol dehydrogenase/oxidoreductase